MNVQELIETASTRVAGDTGLLAMASRCCQLAIASIPGSNPSFEKS